MIRRHALTVIPMGVLVFLYLPILVLVVQSFNAARYGGTWQGFSLRWYEELLRNAPIQHAVTNTLIVASVTTVVSLIGGTLAAWCLHRHHSGLQRIHQSLVYSPLVVPDILMGISLLLFFVHFAVPLSLLTVILAHITFCLSYVTLVMLGRMQDFDFTLIDAARDLGASRLRVLHRILLPLFGPGLAAGGLLAFTLSVDDFVITYFVAGPGSSTLPVYVYGMMKMGSPALINALCVVFMAVTFTTVILSQLILQRQNRNS